MSKSEILKKAMEELMKENDEIEKYQKISFEEARVLKSYLSEIESDLSIDFILLYGRKVRKNLYRISTDFYPVMNFYDIEFGYFTCDIKSLEASVCVRDSIITGKTDDEWYYVYKKDEFKIYNGELLHISASIHELGNNVYDTPECRVKISDEMSDEYIIDFDKRMLKNLELEISPYFNSESFSEISDCKFEPLPYKRIRK